MASALAYALAHTQYNDACISKREPMVTIIYGYLLPVPRATCALMLRRRLAPILFELVMLLMTWAKALALARTPPLLLVLVRDGTWTFAAVFRARHPRLHPRARALTARPQ
jgi:hypothetical protein